MGCPWYPGHVVWTGVCSASNVEDVEVEPEGFLLQHEESRVFNVCQRLVVENPQEGFVIHSNCEFVTAKHKMSGLIQGISNSQEFSLDRAVPTFCWLCKPPSCQDKFPAARTAARVDLHAFTPLLHQEEPDSLLAPVCSQAGLPPHLEVLYTISNCFNDLFFRKLKAVLQLLLSLVSCLLSLVSSLFSLFFV